MLFKDERTKEKERREYLPKKDISYWYPVSFKMEGMIKEMSERLVAEQGLYIPPYQLIERCVKECLKQMDEEKEAQGRPPHAPYHG